MPAYAYKAHINYHREKILTERSHNLDSAELSIVMLAPIVGDNTFSVYEDEDGTRVIHWTESRDETDEERDRRIKKLESYNAEVDRRRNLK